MTILDGTSSGRLIDHREVDWPNVTRVRFSLQQTLRYDYASPIRDLRHRLMVIPRTRHGDQQLLSSDIVVTGARVTTRHGLDVYGNQEYEFCADRVEKTIEFDATAVVERSPGEGLTRLPATSLSDPLLLLPTPLTWPDRALRAAAERIAREVDDEGAGQTDHPGRTGHPDHRLALARRINAWVNRVMRYRHDVTTIDTTAARALGLAYGVCQDYAHVMLSLCRLNALPARYVSGHLLGEGGSHAWVEVIVPEADGDGAVAVPFDPTHGREVGASYFTVAVGRDFADVSPTYGTFQGEGQGRLSTVKRLGVTEVEVSPAS